MRTLYFVKKNPSLSSSDNWIAMDGVSFYRFIKTPEGQIRKRSFATLKACSEGDYNIVMEAGEEKAHEIKAENNRHNYLRRTQKETGYQVISYHAVNQTDDDFYGEELLIDDALSVEERVLRKIQIDTLYVAISTLPWNDQRYLLEVYLSPNRITDMQYATLYGVTISELKWNKEKILHSLRIYLRNNCELYSFSPKKVSND